MPVEIIESGPLFDGRADGMVTRMLTEVTTQVGDVALFRWQSNLDGSLKHSSGRYQSQLHMVRRDWEAVVNDGWGETNDLPYGPWLEGVGSRNFPTTRFRGYRALGRAFTWTRGQVDRYAQPIVDKWIARLNGE